MIVNVTVSPHHGMPAMAHTGAARAAVESFTEELAGQWRPDGVSVVAIAIGRFATESLRKYPAELWRSAAATVPLQRLGDVEEYGWLVALLASTSDRPSRVPWSRSTAALDNWNGEWPPDGLAEATRSRPRRVAALASRRRDRPVRSAPAQQAATIPRDTRAKCCGCTEAFQASRAGSIPVARSCSLSQPGRHDPPQPAPTAVSTASRSLRRLWSPGTTATFRRRWRGRHPERVVLALDDQHGHLHGVQLVQPVW